MKSLEKELANGKEINSLSVRKIMLALLRQKLLCYRKTTTMSLKPQVTSAVLLFLSRFYTHEIKIMNYELEVAACFH